VWRSLAQLASNYLKKEHTIYLEGKIKTRSYADKTGETRYITEIIGDNLIMLDKPKKSHT
jgi:single-strand DNA-binding protein